jgi:hypothetical protein
MVGEEMNKEINLTKQDLIAVLSVNHPSLYENCSREPQDVFTLVKNLRALSIYLKETYNIETNFEIDLGTDKSEA